MMKIIAAVLLLVLVWLAVKSKTRLKRRTGLRKNSFDLPVEPKDSLISTALAELIATAGGVYVSLLLLVSFLDLTVPGSMEILGIEIDSIAAIALIVALFQPIIMGLFKKHA